jgi:hypothetical protein
MRWLILTVAVVIILALLSGGAYFGLGWWHPPHATIGETTAGRDAASESATLEDALSIAHQALDEIEHKVWDYSAVIVKKERIGKDPKETVMFAKIREKPFSVYLYFLDRSDNKNIKGREVIFVQCQNDDNLLVHTPLSILSRTLSLDPKRWPATMDEHYPITEIGLANLCRQLIKRGEAAGEPSQVHVKRYRKARINSRACTLLEIVYPVAEPKLRGYLARVFVDNELHFPIRVEIHELPVDSGKEPQLLEEYTYLDVKPNNGYTDADFDPKNRQYKFP